MKKPLIAVAAGAAVLAGAAAIPVGSSFGQTNQCAAIATQEQQTSTQLSQLEETQNPTRLQRLEITVLTARLSQLEAAGQARGCPNQGGGQ
ncbi:MAG: hypothetical protein JO086_17135 [Acidimicrobiia bacterium]|nr:hypothetical protein [Acidimicrobiia bacterium]